LQDEERKVESGSGGKVISKKFGGLSRVVPDLFYEKALACSNQAVRQQDTY
jgi:hypothetical protein